LRSSVHTRPAKSRSPARAHLYLQRYAPTGRSGAWPQPPAVRRKSDRRTPLQPPMVVVFTRCTRVLPPRWPAARGSRSSPANGVRQADSQPRSTVATTDHAREAVPVRRAPVTEKRRRSP
jgi:hypothetical protein